MPIGKKIVAQSSRHTIRTKMDIKNVEEYNEAESSFHIFDMHVKILKTFE